MLWPARQQPARRETKADAAPLRRLLAFACQLFGSASGNRDAVRRKVAGGLVRVPPVTLRTVSAQTPSSIVLAPCTTWRSFHCCRFPANGTYERCAKLRRTGMLDPSGTHTRRHERGWREYVRKSVARTSGGLSLICPGMSNFLTGLAVCSVQPVRQLCDAWALDSHVPPSSLPFLPVSSSFSRAASCLSLSPSSLWLAFSSWQRALPSPARTAG
jgi:hypothetical protein